MNKMDPGIIAITLLCVIGSSFMSYYIGKREGITAFLSFLESHKNGDNIVKIKMTADEVEFIK